MEFKEVVQRVKNEYDIVDYIKTNGVNLENSGNGQWKGLCPFHNEKTPSFTVSDDFQSYKCFGCGTSGDILNFSEHIHAISFFEALKLLAEDKGIEIDDKTSSEVKNDINGIRQVIKDAQVFFKTNYDKLDNTHLAKQEIIKRNLNAENNLYGYSLEGPNELYKYLHKKGHSDKNIEDSKLVIFYPNEPNRQPWDFFHGRLMITLADYLGRPISFTSRKIYEDDKMPGKYVNGKESPVYHKKANLFGADLAKTEARKTKTIYVVEGQFDQISMSENGVNNVVATSGTAFTDEHANLLLRMVGHSGKIIFIMDGDDAGIEAAIKVFTSCKALHSNAYAVLLRDKKDPCDYIEEGGIELLLEEIKKSVTLHDFVVDATLNKLGGNININNRHRFAKDVAKFARNADDPYIIDSMLGKASVLSAVSISNIKNIYNKIQSDTVQDKKTEPVKQVELNPLVKLNLDNEGDLCMFSALSLLIRAPDVLVAKTPNLVHKKFRPFLNELEARYDYFRKEDEKWRFITEDYNDSDFAKALQNKVFLENPKDDIKSTISQYSFLFNKANTIYKKEYEDMEKAKALSCIIDSTDAKEVANALNIYAKSKAL